MLSNNTPYIKSDIFNDRILFYQRIWTIVRICRNRNFQFSLRLSYEMSLKNKISIIVDCIWSKASGYNSISQYYSNWLWILADEFIMRLYSKPQNWFFLSFNCDRFQKYEMKTSGVLAFTFKWQRFNGNIYFFFL